jgi:hypothetical protein
VLHSRRDARASRRWPLLLSPPGGGRKPGRRAASALARQQPVAARRELARPREQRLHLAVQRLGLAAAGVREPREEVARLQQVLVREEEVAAEARAGAGEDEPALEQARDRLAVRVEDGAQPRLVIAQPAVVARVVEVDDRGRPLRSLDDPRRRALLSTEDGRAARAAGSIAVVRERAHGGLARAVTSVQRPLRRGRADELLHPRQRRRRAPAAR